MILEDEEIFYFEDNKYKINNKFWMKFYIYM